MQTKNQSTFVVAFTAENLLAFGKSHGYPFLLMDETGVLTEPVTRVILKSHWVFEPDSNTNLTPGKKEAYRRLQMVLDAGFPVKQVIYGYQVKPEKKPVELPKVQLPQVKISPETVKFAGAVAVGGVALVAGAAALLVYGIFAALAADPLLAVVCEGDERWICLYSWDE